MKPFLNPALFLLCVLLLVVATAAPAQGDVGMYAVIWALVLCLLGSIVNGTLGLARALTGRPSLQSIGWAVGFIVFGSIVWTQVNGVGPVSMHSEENALLEQRVEAWKSGQQDPYALDANGDSVPVLAAGLGREDVLAQLLEEPSATASHGPAYARAAHRAAEHNREQTLRQLVAAGLSADVRWEGLTPLHTAALNKARRAAATLLELGADVNAAAAADGSTPLHHAVLADDETMVRLLLQHGADPKRRDADGRDAASYARMEGILDVLAPQEALPAPVAP